MHVNNRLLSTAAHCCGSIRMRVYVMLLIIVSLVIHYYVITYNHVSTKMNNEMPCAREIAVKLSSVRNRHESDQT